MRAVLFRNSSVHIEAVKDKALDPHHVRIMTKAVGLCGTDYAIASGSYQTVSPLVLGHEFTGVVTEVGSKVDQNWLGKRVTAEINTSTCGHCFYCTQGMRSHCPSRKALGIHRDGALADEVVLEDSLLHQLPDNLSFIGGTFVEPLAAAYQTFVQMPVSSGPSDQTLVVFGLGKMGLLVGQVAKQHGYCVVGVGGSTKKLQLARELGFDVTVNRRTDDPRQEILKMTEEVGADVVVDTSGDPTILNQLIGVTRSRGSIHVKSTPGTQVQLDLTQLVVREITLSTSRCGPFEQALEGLRTGTIHVRPLVTKVISLEESVDVLNNPKLRQEEVKVVVQVGHEP